jgi:hypothetical protein
LNSTFCLWQRVRGSHDPARDAMVEILKQNIILYRHEA